MEGKLAALKQPPPTDTTIVTGPSSAVSEGRPASFTYFSQSRFATFECRLDVDGGEGTWEACGSQLATYNGLPLGDYVFNVRATDEFATTDPTPASRAFTIADLIAPVVSITSGPPDPTEETTASFDFSSNEQNATFACSLDLAPPETCTSPWAYAGLSVGSHVFEVTGTDPSGNVSVPADWSWTVVAPP
jgi:hypothetical protein